MKLKKYQNYINLLFLNKFLKVSFIFFCTVVIVNFLKKLDFQKNIIQKFIIQFTCHY